MTKITAAQVVGEAVTDAVTDAVGEAVTDAVTDAVGEAVSDAVGEAVGGATQSLPDAAMSAADFVDIVARRCRLTDISLTPRVESARFRILESISLSKPLVSNVNLHDPYFVDVIDASDLIVADTVRRCKLTSALTLALKALVFVNL